MKTKNDTLNAIQTMVDSAVNKAGYDKTRNAVILARNANNTYKIKMDGIEYDNVVFYGLGEAQVNEVVKVVIPNNQASQMYVVGKGGNGGIIATDSNPIGSVIAFAGSNAPVGYLVCDGSAVSREIYAELFAVIGTTYGAGDGSTTFNLPDFNEEYKKLLWTNPSPTATFAAQTVLLDLSGYESIEVKYLYSTSYPDSTWYFKTYKRGDANMLIRGASTSNATGARRVFVSETGVGFGDGYYNTSLNNIYCVPVEIYGIKETTPVIKASHSVTIQGVDTMSEAEYQDLLERLV